MIASVYAWVPLWHKFRFSSCSPKTWYFQYKFGIIKENNEKKITKTTPIIFLFFFSYSSLLNSCMKERFYFSRIFLQQQRKRYANETTCICKVIHVSKIFDRLTFFLQIHWYYKHFFFTCTLTLKPSIQISNLFM